jgi:rare lipoprotein A
MKGARELAALPAALLIGGCTMVGSAPTIVPPAASPSAIADVVPRDEPPSETGNMPEYQANGRTYRVRDSSYGYDERGLASWYGKDFNGRRTSSGEVFDMYALTAAHRTLPIPTYVKVTNLANGRSVIVRVNDRGPFSRTRDRIIDLSYAAAVKLDMARDGTANVRVQAVEPWQYRVRAGG